MRVLLVIILLSVWGCSSIPEEMKVSTDKYEKMIYQDCIQDRSASMSDKTRDSLCRYQSGQAISYARMQYNMHLADKHLASCKKSEAENMAVCMKKKQDNYYLETVKTAKEARK